MKLNPSHFARSVLSVYAATCASGVLGLIAVPVSLHFLGSEGYGLFSIYMLMAGYVTVADFGIGKNLLALLSRERESQDQINYLRTALGLYCWICAGWVLLLPLLWWLVPAFVFPVGLAHRDTLRWLTVLAVAEFAIGVPLSLSQTSCVARQEFGKYSKYTVLSGISRQTVLIAGAAAFHSPVGVAGAMAARRMIDVYWGFRIMGAIPKQVWRPRFAPRPALAMLSQSGTLSVAQVLGATFTGAGSYLVNARFGLHWLGLYRAAFDLAAKTSVIANGITLVLFPKLAAAFANRGRREALRTLLRPALEVSWIFYSAFGACAVVAAPWVLPAIGIHAPDAFGLFVWLAIGLSINCHTQIANEMIQASGRYRGSILVNVTGLAVLVSVFAACAGGLGPLAIGAAWIAAAVACGLLADSVILSSLDVPGAAQAASGAKKALMLVLACATLVSYYGFAPRALAIVAAAALIAILIRDGLRLLREVAPSGWPHPADSVAEEQVVTA